MRKFSKRLLTWLLAAAMVFGLSGMTAFAAETSEGTADVEAVCDDCCAAAEDAVQPLSDSVTSERYNHGNMTITSEEAEDNVITLDVGEEAEITIHPYAHDQYAGCTKSDCPDGCASTSCFLPGYGCQCNPIPTLRYADVDVNVADDSIVSAGAVTANGDAEGLALSETMDGTLVLTANEAGMTRVTVTTTLRDWISATETYTVIVEEGSEGSASTVNYAVKIWGIETDTYSLDGGETTQTAGLTFGPAVGGSYVNSYKSCDSEYCIHNMTWDEIIEQSKEDPTVFESCLENGCTKAVELTPNETLFNMETVENAAARGYTGDGVSTLLYLLNGTEDSSDAYAVWNASRADNSTEDPANVYSRSRVRTTLTGDQSNIQEWMTENPGANDYYDIATLCDETNCLLSCFPTELQDAVLPRTTLNSGNATTGNYKKNDKTTFDKLFLFSVAETGITNASDDSGGTSYNISGRTAYEFSSTDAISYHQEWWTRSGYSGNNYYAFYIGYSASESGISVNTSRGLSPGFCLPGPEWEEPVDKTDLENEVAEAETLNEDDYTTDSWAVLLTALAAAQGVLDNADATQDEVNAALLELQTAIDNLEPVVEPEEGITVNVTYAADATKETMMLTDSEIQEAVDAAPETTLNRGDREYTEQFVLVTDLLSDYLGIDVEDVSYAEAKTSDGWDLNNIESGFDFSEWYLYDGGGYWRLAIPDAGQNNWLKYMDEFDLVVGSYNDIPVYQNGELLTTITGDDFALAQAKAKEQTFTRITGMGSGDVTEKFVSVKDLLGDYQPDEGCGFVATAESDGFTSTYTADIYEDAYFYCEEGTGYYRTAMDGAWGYMWCTDVTYFIVGHNYEDGACTICGEAEPYPESEHNYSNNEDESWTYTLGGAENGVYVTFDEQTYTESGYDYIYVYDGDGNQIGKYDGSSLAGVTLYIPTDTFTVRLTSDSSMTYWGFAVTDVEAAGDKIDLSIVGTVDDPLAAVYVGTEDVPADVKVNGVSLVQGTDFIVEADTSVAGETVEVTITGIGAYTGTLTTHVYVWDEDHLQEPASIASNMTGLRQSSAAGTSSVSLENADNAYKASITEVTLRPVETDAPVDEGGTVTGDTDTGDLTYPNAPKEITLTADELTISGNNLTFNRTEDDPIVYVMEGHGFPYTYTNARGQVPYYPQTQVYEVTVKADGYVDAVGLTTFYTGTSAGFSIIEDMDGDHYTTDDQNVLATWTSDEIREMASFANGSSQCGMTGFRTFTTNGVSLVDLLDEAGVTVSADDSFLLQTSDDYGNTFSYSQLFGATRYFMSGIYDPEFVDIYNQAASDSASGGNDLIRRWLANYALEHDTTIDPRICVDYNETLIYGDDINAGVTLPTAENTVFNRLVSFENQYRFVYGIEIVQDAVSVNFDTQGGSDVESQTVLTHPMTSTSNTTMWSSYWGNSLIIYRGQGDGVEEPAKAEGADTIAVPTTPTKEGYVFAGWYTDADCTDGNEFDFEANDGTVEENTTLYAKWISEDEAIGIVDFDITSAEHDDADGELNQTIIATITFSDNIALAHEDLRDDLLITIAGGDVYDTDRTITYEVQNGNQLVITMVSTDWVAITSGMLQIQDITGEGIVAADSDKTVIFATQSGRIPTGIVVNNDMIAGTDAEPASTYVAVAHKANMRGMYAYELVSIDADGNETVVSSGTSHAHDFYGEIDEAAIASAIAGTFSSVDGYTVEYTEGDTYFIITADNAVEGENLAVRMVEWKAEINEAHAPSETVAEDGMLITRCSFCGDVFSEEPIPVTVDKTVLNATISAAEALDAYEEYYTPDSWEALQNALDAAKAVSADANVTQDEVNDATVDLVNALAGLALKEQTDKTILNAMIAAAEALDAYKDYYTPASWEALQNAVNAAKAVSADDNATQDDINSAAVALVNALVDLETEEQPTAVDKTVLEAAIDTADALDESAYTADSWAAMQAALEAAKTVDADPDATQDAVNDATVALVTAIVDLQTEPTPASTVDKSELLSEIVIDSMLPLSCYTADTWAPFEESLLNAVSVLADPEATQDEVDAAVLALKTAKDNLVLKDGLIKDSDGIWRLYSDGLVCLDYYGFAENANGKWYVENGVVTFTKTDIIKDRTGAIGTAGDWYYVIDSKVQTGFTGLSNFRNVNGWWYIKDGKVDFTHNGVDKNQNGWYYVEGGKVQFGFTGLSNYKNDNGWWYIAGGKVDFTHNGVDKNKNGWFYVVGGKVQSDFTGLGNYGNANGWWYIKDGKVDFTHNGVDKNKNGWWYVSGGKVNFNFHGIASNQNGTWYLNNGKVQFAYSGTVTYNGKTYTVRNGYVI